VPLYGRSVEKSAGCVYVVVELDVSVCEGVRVLPESRRSVRMFELVSWPHDRRVPPVNELLQFTSVVRCHHRRHPAAPLLVFGTAEPAVGRRDRSRAAVFTALWQLMEQAELDAVVDVFAAVRLTCLLLPSALINEVIIHAIQSV